MPVNTDLYEISDVESNHFGDSTTTLKMLTHYGMMEPNSGHKQGGPETRQLLLA